MKTIVFILACLGILAMLGDLAFGTAVQEVGEEPREVQLLMWSGAQPFMDTLDKIKEAYEQETGRKLQISTLPWDEMYQKQVTTLAAGDTTYDVIYLAPKWLTEFAEGGYLQSLDDKMDSEVEKALSAGSIEPCMRRGHLYALPKSVSSRFFIYRNDLYRNAGIGSAPTYMEEMVDYGQKIQKLTDGETWGYLAGLRGNIGALTFTIMLNLAAGKMWDDEGYPAFVSPEGIRAVTFMSDLVNKYKITPPAAIGWSSSRFIGNTYNSGEGAQMIEMPEKYNWANDPELSDVVGKSSISINPGFKGSGRRSASRAAYESIAIPSSSNNQEAAWHFIKWFATAKTPNKYWIEYGYPPLATSVLNDPTIQKDIPWLNAFKEQITYPCETWEHVSDFSHRRDIIMEEIEAVLSQAKTPQEALEAASERIKEEVMQ